MSSATPTASDGIMSKLPEWNFRKLGLYALITVFFAFFISPIWTGLVTSFKADAAGTAPLVPPGPTLFTFENWNVAFEQLSRGFINSFLMAIPSTLLDVLFGSMAAYALTLVDWKRQLPVLLLFMFGIFIPYQAVLVPLANFWTNVFDLGQVLGFVWATGISREYAELVELTITHVAYGIPICVLLFRSYYNTISDELVEAAKIDGASVTRIYTRIVLPLSKPMIGVVLIYQFTQIWNEFLFSLTLIGSSSDRAATITLILSGLGADLSGIDFGVRMAGAFLAALPTIIIYVLFAEQFAEGLRT